MKLSNSAESWALQYKLLMLVLGSQEAGLSVLGQRELHSKTLFQNKTRLAKVAVTG